MSIRSFYLLSVRVYSNDLHKIQKPYEEHSLSMKVIQRDPLNDPSIYVINRKSLLRNKVQVNYNDNQPLHLCSAFSINCFKCSESFLGDMMHYYHLRDEHTKPLRNVALDIDKPQVMLFDLGNSKYTFSSTMMHHNIPDSESTMSVDCLKWASSIIRGKQKIYINNLSLATSYSPLRVPLVTLSSSLSNDTFTTMYGGSDNEHRAKSWSSHHVNDKAHLPTWEDVIYPLWVDSDYKAETRGGEMILMHGIYWACA